LALRRRRQAHTGLSGCLSGEQTIENTREKDETTVGADDEEVEADEAGDEFADHFGRLRPPNVLLTTCYKPSAVMFKFLADMLEVNSGSRFAV
jgi:hypothetical protein